MGDPEWRLVSKKRLKVTASHKRPTAFHLIALGWPTQETYPGIKIPKRVSSSPAFNSNGCNLF